MKLRILGYDYTVVTEGTSESIGASGRWLPKKQVIQVAGDLSEEYRISTILHEVIEILNEHLGLGLEHRDITALEAGLYQVLKDASINLSSLDPESPEDEQLERENATSKEIQVICPHCKIERRILVHEVKE